MILITLVLGAISFFLAVMFTKSTIGRFVSILVTGIILLGSIILMVANFNNHFGMEKRTTTKTTTIYSASNSDSMPLMLYKAVGTSGKNDVYVYNLKSSQKTPNHTQADEYTTNKVTTTKVTSAKLVTKTTRWVWKNNFYKELYRWSGMNNKLVKRVNNFKLPTTWVKLSTTQAAALQKKMADPTVQAQSKTAGTAYVTAKVTAAMQANPSMTATQQAAVAKQAQAEFTSQALKQAVASLK